jgi:hypothetical protein
MKTLLNIIFILSILSSLTVEADNNEYEYIKQAHNSGIYKCDISLHEGFGFFNNLKENKYQLYQESINSLTNGIKTIRFYFSSGKKTDIMFGDITIIQTLTECQSIIQISMKFDDKTCSSVMDNNNWKFDESHDSVKWYENSKGYNGNSLPINNNQGCLFKFYKTNIQKYE